MNARLSSLLVAGGVVLAGIQSGSLTGAIPDAGPSSTIVTLQGASFQPSGAGSILKLDIPGFRGVPRLQVLAKPSRVVVDLPGVNRGVHPTKKDLQTFSSPLVLRSRIAQFLTAPEQVTRLVLEVVDGTQVEVSSDGTGVSLTLAAGKGGVEVQYAGARPAPPVETEAVAVNKLPVTEGADPVAPVVEAIVAGQIPAAEAVAAAPQAIVAAAPKFAVVEPVAIVAAAPKPAVAEPVAFVAGAPKPAAVEPVAVVAAAPKPAAAELVAVVAAAPKPAAVEPVTLVASAPKPAVAEPVAVVAAAPKPAVVEPVAVVAAAPKPAVVEPVAVVAAAPKPAAVEPVAVVAAAPKPAVVEPVAVVAAAPKPAAVEPVAVVAAAPKPAVVEPVAFVAAAPKPAAVEPVAVVAAAPAMPVKPRIQPLPSVGGTFQTLPALAVSSLLPVTPGAAQDRPAATPLVTRPESRRDEYRAGRTLGDNSPHYTGTRMSIDVTGTDLTSFLRIIAETAHLNLIADQDVQGTYTFKFNDTPWDQVLDVILKHAGLGKEVSNGIIRVAKIEKLQKEEEDRKRLDDARALGGDLQSITRPLSFAKASEAKNILDKVLTKRGSLIIDERTNTLIISELPRNIPLLDDLIAQLDVQIQQVQIEARVVEATKNFQKAFGVQWPTANTGAATLTTGASSTAATWGSYNGQSWNSINNLATSTGNAAAVAFSPGVSGVTSIGAPAGQFWLSFLSNRMSINVILQALESEGVVKIISSPKVVTQNNKKAKVLSGSKIPYPSQQGGASGGAITVAFVDANLELDVTPQITNDGTILMDIHVEKSAADFSTTVNGTPTIDRKVVETQVLVKDGGTAIMGGVYTNQNTKSKTGVPFLMNLPFIGGLFRTTNDQDQNDELLVFITPRILKN